MLLFLQARCCQTQRVTVTKRNSINNIRLILVLAVFLLLCGGLQSAFGCLLQGSQSYSAEIRVNSCHLVADQKKATPCCQIEACHQAAPQKRNLASPEYHTLFKDSHSLAHESRPLTPELKVGKPFITNHMTPPHFFSLAGISQTPLQSLYSLRTIVLLT